MYSRGQSVFLINSFREDYTSSIPSSTTPQITTQHASPFPRVPPEPPYALTDNPKRKRKTTPSDRLAVQRNGNHASHDADNRSGTSSWSRSRH